jgi:ADP-heptose:LPS heptosyltransferase
MPTADRRAFVARAVEYFLRQDYAERELIVVDDGRDAVGDLLPEDGRVRYVRLEKKLSVGAKRNLACEAARGRIIAHWDDDDWHAPHRLSYQVGALVEADADACGISTLLFYEPKHARGWLYTYPPREKLWLSGSSLCYRREFWARNPFQEINVGEDARFVWGARGARMIALPDPTFHVGIIHAGNVSPKRTGGAYWKPHPPERIRALLGDDAEFYDRLREGRAARRAKGATAKPAGVATSGVGAEAKTHTVAPVSSASRTALVTAAYGVGDILRVTPLVRALASVGYAVDVLVAPDYVDAASLLEGAPEIRRLFVCEDFRKTKGRRAVPGLPDETYDLATFTVWSAPLKRWVRARKTCEFDQRDWLREGDAASVEKIARAVGFAGEMPAPFAVASDRRFGLAPDTVALHPGCKPDWPWKKWHGFADLARLFPSVVVVGTESDLQNERTYFRENFEWPAHAQNFAGRLSLRDTAALLSECAALVSNDSGLMHLGVAVGTPTFGVFGITSPARESLRSPLMHAVTKKLACEPQCRRGAWGRRDCDRHLECLKTLTAREVYERVTEQLPNLGAGNSHAAEVATVSALRTQESSDGARSVVTESSGASDAAKSQHQPGASVAASGSVFAGAEELSLVYYGYVFDATGYGHAARAYIHALASAGVRLSVVPLTNRPREVRDDLVESLVGRRVEADFHLFHGIPPQWASRALPLRNAIGMTVWETDAMPPQWRSALNRVLEVWLPCEHNVSVFRSALERPVFKLPHPLMPARVDGEQVSAIDLPGVAPEDFVFYSVFEWQQRKSPRELIEIYLREFRDAADAVLFVKTNASAARAAEHALGQARRATGSHARVLLRAEHWSGARIDALHARGDCYLSLHRGEGWGYPAFEAAARGTPVVATAHSGPLEYLDPEAHSLVRCRPAAVRQPYVYYTPRMSWAEPDFAHAAELMRHVYSERDAARERAAGAAARLRERFSLEAVGSAARAELSHLLNRTNPRKARRLAGRACEPPSEDAPLAGAWYDADYFEHGLKSNWERGYSWQLFGDLFRRTARMLSETFAESDSFLDAGCAKGLLVRALREVGRDCRGFDHSPWAVAHADEAARPFVTLAGVDDYRFEQDADVLVALNLFETLTEEQISTFLARARPHTRHALFAVIQSFADDAELAAYERRSRDLSQTTLRTRDWWRETIFAAGWRQDALARLVERQLQSHELPRRMNWQVYVFAPE